MLSRRRFTTTALSAGVLALPGCGVFSLPQPQRFDLGDGAIDVHMHLFNGRDVPALGFLQQVIFRDLGDGLPGAVLQPLAVLITSFLLAGTRTAAQELGDLGPGQFDRQADRAQDEARLARAIDDYYGQAQDSGQAIMARRGGAQAASTAIALPQSDAILLDEMAKAAGVPVAQAAAGMVAADAPAARSRTAAPVPSLGQQLAPGLLSPQADSVDPKSLNLAGILQWATLMTRDRADIRARARALYGKPGEARIFCNYLVDMGLWLQPAEPFPANPDDMDKQIALAARLSLADGQVLVLNFAPFCPLRAAIEGPVALRRVQDAVLNRGFAGVKLYPPMGFRPDDNRAISFAHANDRVRRNPPTGRALDQALAALYAWCEAEDVPIATHASHSMGAGPDTEKYSAPWLWRSVLHDHPGLRVNLAHFGGFGRHNPQSWQQQLGALMADDAQLFFDTGYWDRAARDHSERPDGPLASTRSFLQQFPTAGRRMMYGSDWHMIAREPDHNAYHGQMRDFVTGLAQGDGVLAQAIMGGNALRWLGLDRADGRQFRRLAGHFGGHPVWRSVFG